MILTQTGGNLTDGQKSGSFTAMHITAKLAALVLLVFGLAACQSSGGPATGAAPAGGSSQRSAGSSEGGGY
jgi:hypothetical protein